MSSKGMGRAILEFNCMHLTRLHMENSPSYYEVKQKPPKTKDRSKNKKKKKKRK